MTSTFTTHEPEVTATYGVVYDEQTVGVGMPVSIQFDSEVTDEAYRKEIEELKKRLSEKEAENSGSSGKSRRLSAREKLDESLAMDNLNARIRQLTKLILTSQTVDENKGDESRAASPVKVDFDMSPYQVCTPARTSIVDY